MVGLVHRRPDQVVHRRVQHQEPPPLRPLVHVDHPRQQHAGVGGDHPAGLEGQLHAQPAHRLGDHRRVVGRRRRVGLVEVGHAEAAAEVEPLHAQPLGRAAARPGRASARRRPRSGARSVIWLPMWQATPSGPQRRAVAGLGVEPLGLAERDPELGLGVAGADLGVAAGADVRVDADGDGGAHALARPRPGRQQIELGLRLDVDLGDAGFEREGELPGGLADAGEHDPLRPARRPPAPGGSRPRRRCRRRRPRRARVRTHGDVGVGLQRVGDQRLADLPVRRERVAEHREVPLQRRGGIDIDRRADRLGDPAQAEPLRRRARPPAARSGSRQGH